jgi:hypothetical protein
MQENQTRRRWPNRGSPGLLVMPMSRLFRSAADRASVGIEVGADGRAAERESEHWCIVLVVVERDGSLVLVAEPTRGRPFRAPSVAS